MVFFTCGSCGSCLKKAQVDKHRFQCRGSVFCCMDCQKDFPGEEYKGHIKCITEEQKYSGVGWKPPPGHMKGEKKQESWTETIRNALADPSVVSKLEPPVRRLLLDLTKHDNIPRKKAKFMNFVKNTTRNRFDEVIFEKVWIVLEDQMKKLKPKVENTPPNIKKETAESTNGNYSVAKEENGGVKLAPSTVSEENGSEEVSSSKKKKKKSKRNKEDPVVEEEVGEEVLESPKKKKKSKRNKEDPVVEEEISEEVLESPKKKKKSKRSKDELIEENPVSEEISEEPLVDQPKKKKSKRNKENSVKEAVTEELSEDPTKKKKAKREKEAVADMEIAVTDESVEQKRKKKKSKRNQENGEESLADIEIS